MATVTITITLIVIIINSIIITTKITFSIACYELVAYNGLELSKCVLWIEFHNMCLRCSHTFIWLGYAYTLGLHLFLKKRTLTFIFISETQIWKFIEKPHVMIPIRKMHLKFEVFLYKSMLTKFCLICYVYLYFGRFLGLLSSMHRLYMKFRVRVGFARVKLFWSFKCMLWLGYACHVF